MGRNQLKIWCQNLIFIGVALGATSASWAAKRYVVTINSPLTYQSIKRAQVGTSVNSPAMQALASSGARVEGLLDQVQMVVVTASSARALESLKGRYGIADVEEEFFIPAPKALPPSAGEALSPAETMKTPWGVEAIGAPKAWLGSNYGRGVRVLVLDTGIDKDHPDLASRFEKGRNFADSDLPDAPYDYFDTVSHGTHVSGTIAADGKVTGLVGVAPEASLLAARVCSRNGCSSISILNGLNWGIQEKVDVMNLSLGGPFPSRAGEAAYKRAVAAGIVVVCASGNESSASISYPAAYDSTIAVGAVDEKLVKAEFSNWGPELDVVAPGVNIISSVPQGQGRAVSVKVDFNDGQGVVEIPSLPVQGSAVQTEPLQVEIVPVGLGKPDDYQGLNVQGKIALILRGEITFGDKMKNAMAAGAAGVIFYNNEPGILSASLGEDFTGALPAAFISQESGSDLVARVPIAVNLYSHASDFELMMGTSMATPHVTGVAALVKAANPLLTPLAIRDIIKSTAVPLTPNDENQYGSGFVAADAAVNKALGMDSLLPKASGL